MNGLLVFLVSSAISALAGTVLKGLLRPITWTLFGVAALLAISGKVVEAVNTVDLAQAPSPTSNPSPPTVSPSSSPVAPLAIQGWQAIAQQIEPAVSTALVPAPGSTPEPGNGDGVVAVDPSILPGSLTPIPGLW